MNGYQPSPENEHPESKAPKASETGKPSARPARRCKVYALLFTEKKTGRALAIRVIEHPTMDVGRQICSILLEVEAPSYHEASRILHDWLNTGPDMQWARDMELWPPKQHSTV
jgi:hypothetical protein